MQGLHLPAPERMHETLPANRHSRACATMPPQPPCGPGTQRPGLCGRREPGPGLAVGASGQAVLVDVRTDAERAWVGEVPGAVAVAWKQWPGMALNPSSMRRSRLLCRRAARPCCCNAAAACAPSLPRSSPRPLGLEAWNVLEGFEGDPDEHAHRGRGRLALSWPALAAG